MSMLDLIGRSSARLPKPEELQGHRLAQRLAYDCAMTISREIKPGWSEQRTAALMDTYLRDHGVRAFFHKSFAWFGDRTRFEGFTNYFHFMPTKREMKEDDVVILDTAPILESYVADIGYTFSLKQNSELDAARAYLQELRSEIPRLFASSLRPDEIWAKIDESLRARGYDNCHAMYPFAVLGHRVHRVPFSGLPSVTIPFGLHAYWALLSHGLFSELLGPKHKGDKTGLWAIEPHLGAKGFGAKFEEILVVEDKRAYWLDERVPHA